MTKRKKRKPIRVVVTYSVPVRRVTAEGEEVIVRKKFKKLPRGAKAISDELRTAYLKALANLIAADIVAEESLSVPSEKSQPPAVSV